MAKVKFNVKGVEARSGDLEPIPKGVYLCTVDSLEVTKPAGKDERIEAVYAVKEGDYKGRKLFDYINLESEAAAWKLRQFLETFGLVSGRKETGELDTAKLVGEDLMVRVTHQTGAAGTQWEGQVQSRVGSTFAAGESEESEDEDLDDEEGEEDDEGEVDLDELDRPALKRFIKEQELDLVVKRNWSDDELRQEIAKLMSEDEDDEEDDEEDDDEDAVDLSELDRAELKAFIKEHNLSIRVLKSMSDDALRTAIAEQMGGDEESDDDEEPDEDEPGYEDLSVEELQSTCKERGLKTSGSKKLLIARLEKDDEASKADGDPF